MILLQRKSSIWQASAELCLPLGNCLDLTRQCDERWNKKNFLNMSVNILKVATTFNLMFPTEVSSADDLWFMPITFNFQYCKRKLSLCHQNASSAQSDYKSGLKSLQSIYLVVFDGDWKCIFIWAWMHRC